MDGPSQRSFRDSGDMQDDIVESMEPHASVDDDVVILNKHKTPTCGGWTPYHVAVFLLTFFSYSLFHASRKNLSNVKSTMVKRWTGVDCTGRVLADSVFDQQIFNSTHFFDSSADAATFLGHLDGAFLGAYAVGLYLSGMLGDRFNLRYVLSIGMWGSSILLFLFGYVTEVANWYNKGFYMTTYLLCGFVQSSGWPTEVAIMGNWFGRGSRGFVLGLWSACASIGNIIGAYLSAHFVEFGYEYTFLVNSLLLFCGGTIIFTCLVNHPHDVGLSAPTESTDLEPVETKDESAEPKRAVGILQAILIPGVVAYSLAYACLKLVNYSFFYWLPFYLDNRFHWSQASVDSLSTWYDWGGIVGGLLAGVITDRMGCRTPVIMVMLLASMGALFGYAHAPNNYVMNGIVMAVTGFFIGGPANLISAAVSADLGRHPKIRGSAEALATVTGIIDGTGSVGAAIGQLFIAPMHQSLGWMAVFYSFIVMIFLTTVCLSQMCYKETRDFVQRLRSRAQYIPQVDEAVINDGADDEVLF